MERRVELEGCGAVNEPASELVSPPEGRVGAAKKRLIPMEFVWNLYGTTPSQHRAITVATPCQIALPRILECRWGLRGVGGNALERRCGGFGLSGGFVLARIIDMPPLA